MTLVNVRDIIILNLRNITDGELVYNLQIYETTETGLTCFLMFNKSAEICLSVETELFDFADSKSRIFEFLQSCGESELSIGKAKNDLKNICENRMTASHIEILLGSEKVQFPEIYYGNALPIYECKNFHIVLLCALHYLLSHNYKVLKCNHCGRFYIAKNGHSKYCPRNSTYSGYEEYACKDAVKQIIDTLEKSRKSKYERLRVRAENNNYFGKQGIQLNEFSERCNQFKDKIKECASIENLYAYSDYLVSEKDLPKKYERVKVGVRGEKAE